MARLYTNENFPRPVAEELRLLGHDVLTVQEAGYSEQAVPDTQVLDFAKSQERAVITLNRKHFLRLHQERPDHSGIIVCTFDPDFSGQAHRIHEALKGEERLAGKLFRVNRPGL
ncbi:MAG TPA: DUF5615 family PIN-like protein [Thermoanaerobaculia bacterium]|nr:DUF5615 family PIN-like protein [Thermoanaerobaculia bacterium]